MVTKEMIGKQSKPVRTKIEGAAVRRFAEAIGIPFANQVPPTFVVTLREARKEEFQLPQAGLIHGEQKFTFYRPLQIGDIITYTSRIKDVFERKGRLGNMSFIVLETEGLNPAGERIFTSTSTLIAPHAKEG